MADDKPKKLSVNQRAFLAAFGELGTVVHAAKAAKIDRAQHYLWLKNHPLYPAAFEAAQDVAAQTLEDEAVKRARDGWLEPVFQGGKRVGSIRKKSDTLLIFLLKGARPEKYRERVSTELSGNLTIDVTERLQAGRKRLAERTR